MILLFVLGFILGPVGDYCHVRSGTLSYPQGVYLFYFLQMPFWTPFLFGSATLAMGFARPFFDDAKKPQRPPSFFQGCLGCLAFLGIYSLSGYLPGPSPGLPDIILAILALASWIAFERNLRGLVFGLLAVIGGTAVEIFLVHQGVFAYQPGVDHLFGVPTWLPWLYFSAAMGVGCFGKSLVLSAK